MGSKEPVPPPDGYVLHLWLSSRPHAIVPQWFLSPDAEIRPEDEGDTLLGSVVYEAEKATWRWEPAR